ncbi:MULTISPECIES: AraC family transcriptional regulator [Hymenobacter]|uniref:AraC-type DNA-binding protein n=1 Tax=Hymenobacter mucosus TaxID=1411120 RepID=A0A239AZ29_9BACT|nr:MULTISPECIES: AraC family transcriptional regulator [Hymenobacter]MDF7815545.1 AraC family transcriptional regulator [Hymenobacter sp. YC55]SNS00621.1 AraC-type DNA-binding protein [Hymenobacter mucosus]
MSVDRCSIPPTTVLYIKHIVCARCIRVVRQELEQLGYQVLEVRLGAATIAAAAEQIDWPRLRLALTAAGFALLESVHQTLLGRVQTAVHQLLRQPPGLRHRAYPAAVALELGLPVAQLSAAYARLATGDTLAGYIVRQRQAYAQELLVSSALGVGLIARKLGYSSLAHFSGQFRRAAQCSPSTYRKRQRLTEEQPNDASLSASDIKPAVPSGV